MIYHYTSVDTLEKITSNKTLRFSRLDVLNDLSEYTYALDLVTEEAESIARASNNAFIKDEMTKVVRSLRGRSRYYVACFSKDSDDKNQWMGYTPYRDEKAVRLGFNSIALVHSLKKYTAISEAIYDQKAQRNRLRFLLKEHAKFCLSKIQDKDIVNTARGLITNIIDSTLCRIKHPAFSIEREVRLIYTPMRSYAMEQISEFECQVELSRERIDTTFGQDDLEFENIMTGPNSRNQSSIIGEMLQRSRIICRSGLQHTSIPLR